MVSAPSRQAAMIWPRRFDGTFEDCMVILLVDGWWALRFSSRIEIIGRQHREAAAPGVRVVDAADEVLHRACVAVPARQDLDHHDAAALRVDRTGMRGGGANRGCIGVNAAAGDRLRRGLAGGTAEQITLAVHAAQV